MATGDPDFCLLHKQPLRDCGGLHDPTPDPTPLEEAREKLKAWSPAHGWAFYLDDIAWQGPENGMLNVVAEARRALNTNPEVTS